MGGSSFSSRARSSSSFSSRSSYSSSSSFRSARVAHSVGADAAALAMPLTGVERVIRNVITVWALWLFFGQFILMFVSTRLAFGLAFNNPFAGWNLGGGGGGKSSSSGMGSGGGGGPTRLAVVRLQVGLLGLARSMQDDLERIAERADTSSPDGLAYVLQETVLSLLRHPEYCVYGASGYRGCDGPASAEQAFNELSLDERSKFEEETLVNVNARRKAAGKAAPAAPGGAPPERNEFIVVTILAVADAPFKLGKVASTEDLRAALKKLGSVGAASLSAVEVIWAPQEDGDTMTAQELSEKYPTMISL
jgi:uncharacterized membrane protein